MDCTDLYHFYNRHVNDYLSQASTAQKHVQTLEDPNCPIQPNISWHFWVLLVWLYTGFPVALINYNLHNYTSVSIYS